MNTKTSQSFLKGINRRFTRAQSVNPDFFYTLQNARILSRGNTGAVSRIKGYTKFNQGSTNYSNTLAMESYGEFFIVFYQTSGTPTEFNIDVIDATGAVVFTDSYTGVATTEGGLTVSDENIFIRPHNKVLYYRDSTWELTDYISKIGEITGVTTIDNSEAASATFTISSGASSFLGTKAKASIEVKRNNVPSGKTDTFQIVVDGNATGDITVLYSDSLHLIKKKISDALNAVTAITDDWDVGITLGGGGFKDPITGRILRFPAIVDLQAKAIGSTWNGREISVTNSVYNIINNPQGRTRDELKNFDFSDARVNTTLTIRQPTGGSDSRNNLGPLYVYFEKLDIEIATANIVSTDTYAQIGAKLNTALNVNPTITNRYNIGTPNDTGSAYEIELTAVRGGVGFNSFINAYLIPEGFQFKQPTSDWFTSTFEDLSGGTNSSSTGTLKKFEHYWYKARWRYKDGHVTTTTFPVYQYSDVAEAIQLTIDTSLLDIDGERAQIEIFRKQGEGDFFLIERISPSADSTVFLDDGKPNRASIEEKNNIWPKSNNAESIIDNRLVRGGVEYFNEEYTGEDDLTLVTTDTGDLNELPKDSEAKIYVKPQYDDGTFGYHSLVDTLTFNEFGKKLRISQSAALVNTEKTIKKLGIYAQYVPRDQETVFRFNSPELANKNIPTIADPSFFPNRTRILFGFKYLELKGETDGIIRFRIKDWQDQNDENKEYTITVFPGPITGPIDLSNGHPRKLEVTIFGIRFTYHRIYVEESDEIVDDDFNSIYKLDCFESLKDAIKTKQLKVRFHIDTAQIPGLPPLTGEKGITQVTKDSGNDILNVEVNVTGLIDESLQYPEVNFEESNTMYGSLDSRLYLELEESVFDNIENQNITDYSIANRSGLSTLSPIPFELLNFQLDTTSIFIPSSIDYGKDGGAERVIEDNVYYSYQWQDSIYSLINKDDLSNENRLIFLTSKKNEISGVTDIELTGFRNIENDQLNFVYNNSFNLYDFLVEKVDINTDRTTFLNQIIWSGQILSGTRYSEERNIAPENFFPIPARHGRIVYMESLAGRLYVFCEKGVLVCMIGETIARQKGGQIVVTDSNFITSYFWVFEKLKDIKHDSIVKHGNNIYFTDGYDIYKLGRESGNVTEGALPLDPTHDYKATIDDNNDEYRLSDITDGVTWIYNFTFKQFYGPHTYVTKHGENLKEKVVSVVGNDIVQFGVGNTFSGSAFDTVIESVANDTQESFVDKNFRKFYLDTENDANAVFRYGKDFTSLKEINIADMIVKIGYKHQGVHPDEQNAKTLYWELQSQDDGFLLDDISCSYLNKQRA